MPKSMTSCPASRSSSRVARKAVSAPAPERKNLFASRTRTPCLARVAGCLPAATARQTSASGGRDRLAIDHFGGLGQPRPVVFLQHVLAQSLADGGAILAHQGLL